MFLIFVIVGYQQKFVKDEIFPIYGIMYVSVFQLAGFGSAKVFDHSTIQTFAGTCRWMAPEVCGFHFVAFLTEQASMSLNTSEMAGNHPTTHTHVSLMYSGTHLGDLVKCPV